MAGMSEPDCVFCAIVSGSHDADIVFEDDETIGFLDSRPLQHGHTLLIPRRHIETLVDLPHDLVTTLFLNVQLLARTVVPAMDAEGSFVAMNNRVSQSVPHLHVHIVPRRKGDGLRGFFWPRQKYESNKHRQETRDAIREAVAALDA